jgi:hypothetical protein
VLLAVAHHAHSPEAAPNREGSMTLDRWLAIPIAFAALAFPTLSLADHHSAGGKAEEHRSEKAAENSNAQWDEDNEGQPKKHRGKHDHEGDDHDDHGDHGDGDGDDEGKKHKKDKKDKKHKKQSDSDE